MDDCPVLSLMADTTLLIASTSISSNFLSSFKDRIALPSESELNGTSLAMHTLKPLILGNKSALPCSFKMGSVCSSNRTITSDSSICSLTLGEQRRFIWLRILGATTIGAGTLAVNSPITLVTRISQCSTSPILLMLAGL